MGNDMDFDTVRVIGMQTTEAECFAALSTLPGTLGQTEEGELRRGPTIDRRGNAVLEGAGACAMQPERNLREKLAHLGLAKGELTFTPYFSSASAADPMVLPINSPEVLAKFPPTLLIAGSRDFSLSSLFRTQAALTNVGVEAELHVWDGLWHAFFMDPDLPESKEVYRVIVKFFDRHLERGS
jgi:acetyl esterase/lipase